MGRPHHRVRFKWTHTPTPKRNNGPRRAVLFHKRELGWRVESDISKQNVFRVIQYLRILMSVTPHLGIKSKMITGDTYFMKVVCLKMYKMQILKNTNGSHAMKINHLDILLYWPNRKEIIPPVRSPCHNRRRDEINLNKIVIKLHQINLDIMHKL